MLLLLIRVPACEYQDGGDPNNTQHASLISVSPSPALDAGSTHA
jgi:hypothetical protein